MKIFTILYVFLQGIAVATAQKLPQPFEVDLHIKQKQIGLLDPFDVEIVLNNIDTSIHPVIMPRINHLIHNQYALQIGEAFIEFKRKPHDKWKFYVQIPTDMSDEPDLSYSEMSPKSKHSSGFFKLIPALIWSKNQKKAERFVIDKPGKYFFRLGYKLLQPNKREVIYSEPVEVYFHAYRNNKWDRKAYRCIIKTPYFYFITMRSKSNVTRLSLDAAPFLEKIATDYPKSKFSNWINLISYEAAWFGIETQQENLLNKEAVEEVAQKLKLYRNKILLSGNENVKNEMDFIDASIYYTLLIDMFDYDEEKMKEDDLYKQIFGY